MVFLWNGAKLFSQLFAANRSEIAIGVELAEESILSDPLCEKAVLENATVKKWDDTVAAFLIVVSMATATVKSVVAPLTTDEAWNYNGWISKGLKFILTDYSEANNHILQTALSWFSSKIFGVSEISLRLPSLLGFFVFLAVIWLIIRRLPFSPAIRLVQFAVVALCPYLVDYGALARGYALMNALVMTAVLLMMSSLRSQGDQAKQVLSRWTRQDIQLLAASFFLGLACCVIPLAIRPTVSLALAFLLLGWKKDFNIVRKFCLLSIPAASVILITYLPLFSKMTKKRFEFGALNWQHSLDSLQLIISYIPQANANRLGNPIVGNAVYYPWQQDALPEQFHALVQHPLFLIALAIFALLGLCGVIGRHSNPGRFFAALTSLWLLVMALDLFVEKQCLGVPAPFGRIWLPFIPALLLTMVFGPVALGETFGPLSWRWAKPLVLVFPALYIIHSVDRLNISDCYLEAPDNCVVREIVKTIAAEEGSRRVRIGFPWYTHACFTFYSKRCGPNISALVPLREGEIPTQDYVMVNTTNMVVEDKGVYEPIRLFPKVRVCLLRRKPSTTTPIDF